MALLILGCNDEARARLNELGPVPPALAPAAEMRRLMLALAGGDTDQAKAHAETIKQQLRCVAEIWPEHRITGWSEIARFWRGVDQPDRMFDAWAGGIG